MSSNREAAHALARQLGLCGNLDGVVFIDHDEECDAITAALDTREAETWEAAVEVAWDVAEQANGAAAAIRVGRALEARAKAAREGAAGVKR